MSPNRDTFRLVPSICIFFLMHLAILQKKKKKHVAFSGRAKVLILGDKWKMCFLNENILLTFTQHLTGTIKVKSDSSVPYRPIVRQNGSHYSHTLLRCCQSLTPAEEKDFKMSIFDGVKVETCQVFVVRAHSTFAFI